MDMELRRDMEVNHKKIACQLSDEICDYLIHLRQTYGYRITVHQIEGQVNESWSRLLTYNYHDCAVCCTIKASAKAWSHCVDRQPKVLARVAQSPFVGTCYAGVSECVFPLRDSCMHMRGFLCVSGYTLDRKMSMERARAAASRYGLVQKRLLAAVEELNEELPDLELLSSRILPLQSMLKQLFYLSHIDWIHPEHMPERQKLYLDILQYTNQHFRSPDFSLRQICDHFNISYSFASHLFAEFNEESFARYMRGMRMEVARRYMEHTPLPIVLVAPECGFSDSNYFSSVFKKETGMSPSEYRAHFGTLAQSKRNATQTTSEHGEEN